MSHTESASKSRMEILHEVFSEATHEASEAMRQWTNDDIAIALDDIREVLLEDLADALELNDEMVTMVVLTLEGELGGNLVLLFDEASARQLAAGLLNRQVDPDSEWSELATSAVTETGNILVCAYVNALTKHVGQDLIPSIPYFIQDYGVSVVQQAAMAQASFGDTLLLCDIRFQREKRDLDWRVLFLPTPRMREALKHSTGAIV